MGTMKPDHWICECCDREVHVDTVMGVRDARTGDVYILCKRCAK